MTVLFPSYFRNIKNTLEEKMLIESVLDKQFSTH